MKFFYVKKAKTRFFYLFRLFYCFADIFVCPEQCPNNHKTKQYFGYRSVTGN